MAEEESELELDRFKKELGSLLNTSVGDERGLQSKLYCARFCELVEKETGRWQVPLPQMQVLKSALCAFVQGAASFPSDCEHVRYTLSSIALSVFELLLFFGKDEFPEDPLKDILDSFQECHSSLVRYQNMYLLQVRQIIRDGGPWASPVLQGILKGLEQPQEEVERYLSSELSVFFELRVRYLLACERTREAMALAQRCSRHLMAGQHVFFKLAYLTCLWKTSEQERLLKEMAEIDGKDAVKILCMAETEEKDELLLGLSRSFLLQQLMGGDMYYLWDLVFIWCKLYLRMNNSKEFLEECRLLILSASNIKAVFPFIKMITTELGQDGLTFCLELCARALQIDLKNDPITKSLIYKTIAYLLPNDLEVCRACALLVFFLERTIEAYKTVVLLYNHPDQEYHLDTSPIGNHVRFELIQILKKGLFFDPEFWSLLNIRTNCLKLMSEKVAKAALCEIMEEDMWMPSCCVRGQCKCHVEPERTVNQQVAKFTSQQESKTVDRQVKPLSEEVPLPKKRGRKPGSKIMKDPEPCPVRRSFRQLDLAQNHSRQLSNRHQRFLTRQVEKKTLKRRGRKPRWLLEELAAQAENSAPRQGKKPGRKPKQLNIVKDISIQTPVIEITMEISYPDNEVDLPPDVQGRPVCKMALTTESSFKECKNPCQGFPTQPHAETPNPLFQLLSEESTSSWGEKAKDTEEFVFWLPGDLAFVRKFHTYAKVPEEEGISNDPSTDSAVTMSVHAVEQERPFQTINPVKNPCEPVEVVAQVEIEATSPAPALKQEVSAPVEGTVDTHEGTGLKMPPSQEMPLVTPVDVTDGIVSVLENGTVDSPKDESTIPVASTVPLPDNTQEVMVPTPYSIPDKATDICTTEKATDNVSVHENALETTINTTLAPEIAPPVTTDIMPTTETAPDSHEHTPVAPKEVMHVSESASVITSDYHKTPASLAEEKPQEPKEDQATENDLPHDIHVVTNSSAPLSNSLDVVRILHRCGLCNKECKNSSILRHAFWHYRIERKCMFCYCFKYANRPLCHFKKHIKDLKEGLTELPEKPDQIVPRALPKKMRPGLAQIKSRLLMKLNVRREISPQHKVENSLDANGQTLKQKFKKNSGSTQELEESKGEDGKKEEDMDSISKIKVRYLTRGLVRKSESKVGFLRTRLARKAKARALTPEEDVSGPKDSFVHRLNGVIRKRRKLKHLQEESCQANGDNVPPIAKREKEQEETVFGPETELEKAGSANNKRKSLNWANLQEKAVLLQKHGIKKRKNRLADQKEDGKSAKRRKVDSGRNKKSGADEKQKESATINPTDGTEQENVEASVTNAIKQENGTELNEISKSVQKKKLSSASPMVRCPVETCTFHTRPSPVLSHVLVQHPGDTKALEFFYNLAKEKCLFCGRRIWSPQHYFDHIVSHRGSLKYPCYHVDCKERFKTRLELGDHMLNDHQPLRAVCCFPGCTGQFANSKLLYSHERIHYKLVRNKPICKKDKSVTLTSVDTGEKGVEVNLTASCPNTTEMQQTPESVTTDPSPEQPVEGSQWTKSVKPVKTEDEKPLMLNRSSVSYGNKTTWLVNGHSKHGREACAKQPAVASKEQEMEYGKMSNKPFVRPPPSAYLDESYISMPKRWKGPLVSPKGSVASTVPPTKRQCCSRCAASFDTEEELQVHREKCTSLFGFDSDDESAS